MKGKYIFAALATSVLVATGLLVKRTPQPALFCDECVMQRDVTEWRLAGRWKLFQTVATSATPVSELLQQRHACALHEHKWSAAQFVGESDLETSQAPRVRSLGFLNAPRTVNFLREVFDYADGESVKNWRAVAWQPVFASALEPALRFERFPENGFTDRISFLAWWSQSAYPLFNKLNEMTVAD